MKVYFTASIRQKNELISAYTAIVDWLQAQHYTVFEKVLSHHLIDTTASSTRDLDEWFTEWSSYVAECDVVVVEGSYPSTIQVGFEIGTLLAKGKPVILLYETGKNPLFIAEQFSKRLVKSEYDERSLPSVLSWCFKEIDHVANRRFTFFVSPQIDEYLARVSTENSRTRSDYIRGLIEKEMRKNS
ncbi:MAG: hypothetical protein Q7S76_02340 [bacterium]|nr:hypothetical protein [bacterium]